MMNEERLCKSILDKMPDLEITPSDIKTPTPKFVQNYFIRFLQDFDLHLENFRPTQKKLTSPASISHVAPLFRLFAVVDEIANRIFINDFSYSDLTQPRPKRILHILNHFDRFHTCADKIAGEVQKDMKEVLKRKELYDELQKEVNIMQEKVQQQGKMKALNDALKLEIEELKKESAKKQVEKADIDAKAANIDLAVEKLEKKRDKLSSQCKTANDQLQYLVSQIVQSPEINHLNLKLNNLEKKKAESEKKIQDLQSLVQDKTQQITVFKKYISDLKQGTEDGKRIVELATRKKMLEEKIQDLDKCHKAAKNKETALNEKLVKLASKAEELEEQKKMIKSAKEEELKELEKKIQEKQRELAEKKKMAESCAELRNKVREMEQQVENKIKFNDELCDLSDELYEKRILELNQKLDKIGISKGPGASSK